MRHILNTKTGTSNPWKAILLVTALIAQPLMGQDFSSILKSIEENSLSLEAARMAAEAEKSESRESYTLENPEVGFGYLFGSNGIGNRKDISISQTFDFPTLMVQKHKMSREMQRVSDLRYLSTRQQLLVTAHKLCIEVVYCNAMLDHLNEDLTETRAMADAYEKLFDKGEATIIERNKAHQEMLIFEAEYREFMAMKDNLLHELQAMNGGEPVTIEDTTFFHTPLSVDFDSWASEHMSTHPLLQLAEGEMTTNRQALKVARNEWTPGIRIGYMGEFTRDDKFQGPTIGLTLPLWGTSRKVKSARLHLAAAEKQLEDTRLQLTTQLRSIYRDALQLQETYHQYRKHLTGCDNSILLRKSLESGQISLLTYLQERQSVHELHEKILEAERDLELRKAELTF